MKELNGVVVGAFQDKRNVHFLSTLQDGQMIDFTNKWNATVRKPNIIVAYNKCKKGIDVADQKVSYYSPKMRSLL